VKLRYCRKRGPSAPGVWSSEPVSQAFVATA